jgi:peptide/nickel transport system permease protein
MSSAETVEAIAAEPTVVAIEAGWDRRRMPRKAWVGLAIFILFVIIAVFAPLIAPYDPNTQDATQRLLPPSLSHLFGTDALGRDQFSRVIFATRTDLPLSLAAVFLPLLVGTAIGAFAGFYGGWADAVSMRMADLVQAFPVYVLLIALVFALGGGVRSILIAFTAVGWVVYARLVRAEILHIRSLEYVQAATVGGLGRRRILSRHVMPNALPQPLIYAASDVVLAVVTLSALSFFGLGISKGTPEWGSMIADGQIYLSDQWWLSVTPGLAIVLFGLGMSLIGDGLGERLRR